jgi:hypothetical protein
MCLQITTKSAVKVILGAQQDIPLVKHARHVGMVILRDMPVPVPQTLFVNHKPRLKHAVRATLGVALDMLLAWLVRLVPMDINKSLPVQLLPTHNVFLLLNLPNVLPVLLGVLVVMLHVMHVPLVELGKFRLPLALQLKILIVQLHLLALQEIHGVQQD